MSVAAADIILKISRSMIKQNNTFGGLLSENPLVFYDDCLCSDDGGDNQLMQNMFRPLMMVRDVHSNPGPYQLLK